MSKASSNMRSDSNAPHRILRLQDVYLDTSEHWETEMWATPMGRHGCTDKVYNVQPKVQSRGIYGCQQYEQVPYDREAFCHVRSPFPHEPLRSARLTWRLYSNTCPPVISLDKWRWKRAELQKPLAHILSICSDGARIEYVKLHRKHVCRPEFSSVSICCFRSSINWD